MGSVASDMHVKPDDDAGRKIGRRRAVNAGQLLAMLRVRNRPSVCCPNLSPSRASLIRPCAIHRHLHFDDVIVIGHVVGPVPFGVQHVFHAALVNLHGSELLCTVLPPPKSKAGSSAAGGATTGGATTGGAATALGASTTFGGSTTLGGSDLRRFRRFLRRLFLLLHGHGDFLDFFAQQIRCARRNRATDTTSSA